MKKTIETYYLINIDNIESIKDYFCFEYQGSYYFYIPCNISENNIENILNMVNESPYLKKYTHDLIKNTNNLYITEGYILMRIKGLLEQYLSIVDVVNFNQSTIITRQIKSNWDSLWSEKVDYFEYQIREIGKDKKVIINSFSYFLGLAETAISYVNKTNSLIKLTEYDRYSIVHPRIYYPVKKINFFNPLSYLMDLEVRDFAEYIKALFYAKKDIWPTINQYFRNKRLGEYSIHLFYARLIYPSTYFDIYEKVILNTCEEEEIIKVVERVDDYKKMLIDIKKYLLQYVEIFNVEWLS